MSSILTIIAVGIFAVLLILGAACVTIVALFPSKGYKGDGKVDKPSDRDESIEDR